MSGYYPWQAKNWQHFIQTNEVKRLPHAILLTGISGLGQLDFALEMARVLICQDSRSEHLWQAGHHPDFFLIQAKENSAVIKIDQIRELIEFLQQKPQFSERQVIIIEPAESMNTAACNALLKMLEEPPGNTVFILVSYQVSKISPTIRSRCQEWSFYPTYDVVAVEWLKGKLPGKNVELLLSLAEGAPLSALQFTENEYLKKRDEWVDLLLQRDKKNLFSYLAKNLDDGDIFLQIQTSVALDTLKAKCNLEDVAFLNVDMAGKIRSLASTIAQSELLVLLDEIIDVRRCWQQSIALNKQLLLERVLLKWLC